MTKVIGLKGEQRGAILISLILSFPFLILIALFYMSLATASLQIAVKDQSQTHSQFAADAGIDVSLKEINIDNSWLGSGTEVVLHDEPAVRTTYQTSVVDNGSSRKTVTSVGRTYKPSSSGTTVSVVRIVAELRSVKSGEYSVVGGVGGLIMSNSAKILGGDVFINGTVSLSNTAQIGLTASPVNLSVAHKNCPNPSDATYPRICNSGENGQPIALSNDSKIYGNVKANNQTNGANMFNPGLTASSGIAAQELPAHDRNAQKAAITSTIAAADASCSTGTKTWAANLKIIGDVTVSGTCKITVDGNVWITGKFNMTNSSQIIVNDALGSTRPIIMFDGDNAKFSNSALLKSNVNATGFMIIAYKSNALCSPDCAGVTGTELFNSQGVIRIELDNYASGPNTIFYARWSKVKVGNNGQLGALIGQTVELSNNSTITFGTSTGTGTSFWVLDTYRRKFN